MKSSKTVASQLNAVVGKMRHIPAFTTQYNRLWEKASFLTEKRYPNQFVLATPMNDHKGKLSSSFVYNIMNGQEAYYGEDGFTVADMLSSITPLDSNGMFKFVERSKAEYNYGLKQLCAFTMIHDGDNMIVLDRRKKSRPYSLPGGHVDFDKDAYKRSVYDTIRKNALKEIREEIDFGGCLHKDRLISNIHNNIQLECILNFNSDWNKIFHSAVLFVVKVDNVTELFEGVTSGEPNIHDVSIVPITKETAELSKCDWLKFCIESVLLLKESNVAKIDKLEKVGV